MQWIVNSSPEDLSNAVKMWHLLPRLILRPQKRGGEAGVREARLRMTRFLQGQFARLYYIAPVVQSNLLLDTHARRVACVEHCASRGHLHKAAQVMQATPITPLCKRARPRGTNNGFSAVVNISKL